MRGSPAKQGRLPRDPPPPLTASPHLAALPRAPPGAWAGTGFSWPCGWVPPPVPTALREQLPGEAPAAGSHPWCLPAARCQRVVLRSPWPGCAQLVHDCGAGAGSRAGTHRLHRDRVQRGPGWSAGPLPASIPCRWACGHLQALKDAGTGCSAVGRAGEASMPSAQSGTANTSVPEIKPQKLASPCGQGGLAAAVPSWGAPRNPGGTTCAGRGDGEGTPGVPR